MLIIKKKYLNDNYSFPGCNLYYCNDEILVLGYIYEFNNILIWELDNKILFIHGIAYYCQVEILDVTNKNILNEICNNLINDNKIIINGDFALFLYDKNSKRVYSARDQIGHKVIYYYMKNNFFIISSSLKLLLQICKIHHKICQEYLYQYMCYCTAGYLESQFTPYESVMRLLPGTVIIMNMNNILKNIIIRYYDPSFIKPYIYKSKIKLINDLNIQIVDSIKATYKNNYAVSVSGGIDSTLTLAILAHEFQNKIICVNYVPNNLPESYSEEKWINNLSKVAFIDLHRIKTNIELPTILEKKTYENSWFDEPGSLVVEKNIYKQVVELKNLNINTILYSFCENIINIYRYHIIRNNEKNRIILSSNHKTIKKYMNSPMDDNFGGLELLSDQYKNLCLLNKDLWRDDINNINILKYLLGLSPSNESHGNMFTESLGLNWRFPLHSLSVFETMISINSLNIPSNIYKWPIINIAKKYLDNEYIVRQKISTYQKNIYKELYYIIQNHKNWAIVDYGYYNKKKLCEYFELFRSGKIQNTRLLFAIISFEYFLRTHPFLKK